jgi:hypothetical protein
MMVMVVVVVVVVGLNLTNPSLLTCCLKTNFSEIDFYFIVSKITLWLVLEPVK